jgi:hypothetical protein
MIPNDLIVEMKRLKDESEFVYEKLVLPNWSKEFHGLPDALYGYMMGIMARIDFSSSAYYFKQIHSQTERMVSFLIQYLNISQEVANILVYLWRHKLMHTSKPGIITMDTGIDYNYLLHWREHLPFEQHLQFQIVNPQSKILNIGMLYFADSALVGISTYVNDVNASPTLLKKFNDFFAHNSSIIKKTF